MSTPQAYVYVDLNGTPHLAGRLWVHTSRRGQRSTFEYDDLWIRSDEHFALEPALQVGPGPFHTSGGRALFGAMGDSAPDRWGRTLLARQEGLNAKEEGRTPRTLLEIDFLLGLSDHTRQGAIRFKSDPDGPFLAQEGEKVPPFLELGRLLQAAERITTDDETRDDLHLLLAPGSSLLGSRPKASVRGRSGELMIAKFNRPDDDYDMGRWEAVAMTLAGMAGVRAASWSVEQLDGRTVLLMKRFDRDGAYRIPFLSAMSMLDAFDGEHRSYMEIADAIRVHSASGSNDLRELWRRIAFSVLISNTDDHLRNHGFLHIGQQGWRLSPAYDLNPVPIDISPRFLSTAIADGYDRSASMDLAFQVAGHFGLSGTDARRMAGEVAGAVKQWKHVAQGLGATARECDRMTSAFEHNDLTSLL